MNIPSLATQVAWLKSQWNLNKLFLLLFLIVASLSWNYAFFKLLAWVVIAFLVSLIPRRFIFWLLAVGGLGESLLAVTQFIRQKSLGLQFLGESILEPLNLTIAKTFLNPGLLLRAYGTFPHPNILAAFLILSLISCYYFFFRYSGKSWQYLWLVMIFINWLGLLVTFSRVGWAIAILMSLIFLLFSRDFINKKNWWRLTVVIIVSVIVLAVSFSWAVIPRLQIETTNFTIQERLTDYQVALEKIKEKPLLGSGLVLAMGERPIHNLYLLIAVELGLIGLLLFLMFIGSFYWQGFANWERGVTFILLASLLLYGFSDHFLWTLRPGMGMLWLIIGLLL